MADKKISQFSNLGSSNYTSNDLLLINHGLAPYNTQTTSNTSVLNFLKYYTGATNTITGGTYNGSALTITFNGTQQNVVMTGYSDTRLTGGTYVITATTGTLKLTTNRNNTFDVTGFTTGFTLTNQVQYNNNSNFSGATTFFVDPSTSQSWNTGTNLEISNTSFGEDAMVNATGSGNTIYGYQSYQSGTTGYYNTLLGYKSHNKSKTGIENIAMGLYNFSASSGTSGNVTLGNYIGVSFTGSGDYNVVIGNTSFSGKTYETGNVVVGYNSYYTSNPRADKINPGFGVVLGNYSARSYYRSNLVTIGNYAIGNTYTHTTQSADNTDAGSVAIGYQALLNFTGISDTNRICNLSIGHNSSSTLFNDPTYAYSNWFVIGTSGGTRFSGELNSLGYQNGAVRYTNNQTRLNTFLGARAGFVVGGNSNTGLGAESCGGTYIDGSGTNTAVGYASIAYCAYPSNVGIGYYANNSISNGQGISVAIGKEAMLISKLYCVSVGHKTGAARYSTIVGAEANKLTSGSDYYLTSVGYLSQYNLSTGANNTSLGYKSLYSLTTSSDNVAIGAYSLYSITGTTSIRNTSIGYNSGYNLTSGSSNTFIGFNAQPPSSSAGSGITLGNSSVTTLRCNQTSITSLSDIRDKKNIKSLSFGLDFVNELNPVTFDWDRRDGSLKGQKSAGFIAQQLKLIEEKYKVQEYLKLTNTSNLEKLESSYGNLIPVLIKSLQDLSKKNKELKERIKKLSI